MATPNPPSIEAAYKRKCIALKHRLNEIETENDAMRLRIVRGKRHVQKQRLETAMLLHRVALLMGMATERPEGGSALSLEGGNEAFEKAKKVLEEGRVGGDDLGDQVMIDDESEGSQPEEPPTPPERPLRSKRSHATMRDTGNGTGNGSANGASASGRRASNAQANESPAPSQDQLQSSFRIEKAAPRQSSHGAATGSPTASGRRGSRGTAAAGENSQSPYS